jgi:hypothetical protein
LLARIAALPTDAFVSPQLAAAFLDTTTGVLDSWRKQRRGPPYHGANQFIRYRIVELNHWMSTRSGEVLEKPEGLFNTSPPPRLVWSQSATTNNEAADHPPEAG